MRELSLVKGPNDHKSLFLRILPFLGRSLFTSEDLSEGQEVSAIDGPYYVAWINGDLPEHERGFPITINEKHMRSAKGFAKFLNHSCKPNCVLRYKRGMYRVITLRFIRAGEQLTIDYGTCQYYRTVMFYNEGQAYHGPCLCGEDNCRGFLLAGEDMPEDVVRLRRSQQAFTRYVSCLLKKLRGL